MMKQDYKANQEKNMIFFGFVKQICLYSQLATTTSCSEEKGKRQLFVLDSYSKPQMHKKTYMDPIHDLSNSFFYLFVPLIKYLIIKERSQKKDGEDLERESNDMT